VRYILWIKTIQSIIAKHVLNPIIMKESKKEEKAEAKIAKKTAKAKVKVAKSNLKK